MSLTEDRIDAIERKYVRSVRDILVLTLTDEFLRLVLWLHDGTTLRVAERWRMQAHKKVLVRYSYYWLDAQNQLKIGWDNVPHHAQMVNFPHHKHIEQQDNVEPSHETSLEQVMVIVLAESETHL